jgi:hypothetical protein
MVTIKGLHDESLSGEGVIQSCGCSSRPLAAGLFEVGASHMGVSTDC